MRFMLEVMSVGQVTEDYVDYVAADLRLSDADEAGPRLESTVAQRSTFPVVIIGCGEAGLLAGIKLKQAGIPFTLSTVSACSLGEVAKAASRPFWFQLYMIRDRAFMRDLLASARAAQ